MTVANEITLKIATTLHGNQIEIEEALSSGQKCISLDFSLCNFISVEGLEWLEAFLYKAQSLQIQINLINIQPSIYKVFKVAHIDNILKALGSTPAAFAPTC